jgi:hypothetical protein
MTTGPADIRCTGEGTNTQGICAKKLEVDRTRDYRNLIHPAKAIREKTICNRGTAYVAVGALEHVISDLRNNL